MNFVKNDFVYMDWLQDNFIESKKSGFVAAIQEYETPDGDILPVGFMDQRAFLLVDEEGVLDRNSLITAIKDSYKEGLAVYDYYEDCYVQLATVAGVDEDTMISYGFEREDIEDIQKRLKDLSCYWVYVEEDM